MRKQHNKVKLIYAKSPEYSATSAYYVYGYVLVFGSDLKKRVIVHYTYDHKSWFDCEASFLTYYKQNFEVWYFKTPNTYNYNSCSFCICCEDNKNEYWDNNGKINYNLRWYFPTKIFGKCYIVLDRVFKTSNKFWGSILIKNLCYDKQIKVRYSTNKWETYNEIDAAYSYQISNDLEVWKFCISMMFTGEIQFYVYFVTNKNAYYDKNFGRYYLI